MPSPFEPMLASSGALPQDDERWAFEPKWDGFRAIVQVKGRAVVWSRRATDLTDRFPEVAELASAVPPATVLDGELVVFDASGHPDFEAMVAVRGKCPGAERPGPGQDRRGRQGQALEHR